VLSPLLSNENNHEGWPEVVAQDVLRHVQNVKSRVYVVSGQVRGKTLLPLPVGADRPEALQHDSAANDKYGKQYVCVLSVLTAIFPGEPGLAGFIGANDNASGGDNWSY